MSVKKELLASIFEPALTLENKKPANTRSLALFERMAERLDEIAANTRGFAKSIIANTSILSQVSPSKTQKGSKNLQNPIARLQRYTPLQQLLLQKQSLGRKKTQALLLRMLSLLKRKPLPKSTKVFPGNILQAQVWTRGKKQTKKRLFGKFPQFHNQNRPSLIMRQKRKG